MHVTLIAPERSLYDGDAHSVVAPAYDGLVGILPGHAPFLTLLGAGTLIVEQRTIRCCWRLPAGRWRRCAGGGRARRAFTRSVITSTVGGVQ